MYLDTWYIIYSTWCTYHYTYYITYYTLYIMLLHWLHCCYVCIHAHYLNIMYYLLNVWYYVCYTLEVCRYSITSLKCYVSYDVHIYSSMYKGVHPYYTSVNRIISVLPDRPIPSKIARGALWYYRKVRVQNNPLFR